MTPERWVQLEDAFHRAVELDAQGRARYLDELRARDRSLADELAALLASDDTASAALNDTIAAGAVQFAGDVAASRVGARVGAYRLVGLLGEGGMGSVYRGRRDDDAYRRDVAVKVLRHGLASVAAIARFREERQILAALDHPGIVRLLDGGSTDDGAPFLVLEFVEGVPITHYARQRGLSLAERVDLLIATCEAVQYAHQRLVVHRDIKPTNILVNAQGAPKLLDFGIAKLLDPTAELAREIRTRTGMALLTPEYASPEQARGEPVSTATDVYSLGAVLYELISDHPAHPPTANAVEALRVICEVEPPRPSTVAPRERRAALIGDLDNIVIKALHKEPAGRYATVEQLADDLRRYRDGQPVIARPATLGYRARKFLRRHRGKVAIAAVVTAALIGTSVWSLREAARADREAARAARRFAEGHRLANTLMFEIESQIRTLKGSTAARELITRSALIYLDGLAADTADDPTLSRDLALAYMKLGDIFGDTYDSNLGRAKEGLAAYEKARAILDHMTSEHDAPATHRARAMCLLGMGLVHHGAGDQAQAEQLLRDGLALADSLPVGEQLAPVPVIRGFNALAFLDENTDVANRDAMRMMEVASAWRSREPASADARYWSAIALEVVAFQRAASADPDGAVAGYREASAELGALVTEYPHDARYARDKAVTDATVAGYLGGIGGAMIWQPQLGHLADAIDATRSVLPAFTELDARDLSDTRGRADLGGEIATFAALMAERDAAAAVPEFERALAVFGGLSAATRDEYYTRQMEWFAHCAYAFPLARMQRNDEALAQAEQGLAIATRVGSDTRGSNTLDMCRFLVARARRELGDTDGAASLLDANVTSLAARLGAHAPLSNVIGYVESLELLAQLRPRDACSLYQRAARAWAAWPTRSAYIERRQHELDRLAGCGN